ncbi:protein kinase [Phenylobacterium terrae]|uniref:Protein kinase n=1 Tax=Phenylobacterium terrae TaxID=2665495 RepID=A0ABW4MZC8_9CAUL
MRSGLEAAPAPPGAASSRPRTLAVAIGQHSDAGRKSENQDSHGAAVPDGPALALKGVALAVADGISSSPVSRIAAETAVKSFLDQYYATSDTWTVETAGQRVIRSVNAWLHGETRRSGQGEDPDRGHVCTFSAVVLKARTAHLFHVGDARIFRLAGRALEPLTEDHRLTLGGRSYLGRALGMAPEIAIDYRSLPIAEGDVLVLSTDGVHEHLPGRVVADLIAEHADDLELAARSIVEAALEAGSDDNLTVQIVRVDGLPEGDAVDLVEGGAEACPPAPILSPPCEFEGYRVLRQIHASHRSHIYLAADGESGEQVALKVPSVDLRGDAALLRQFMMEEWIARRVDSPHLLKSIAPRRARSHLYVVTEHVEGITLRQWMYDNPAPDLPAVRDIVGQLVKGVRALHRKQMVHGDLRPENVMITPQGLVKVIDFGSVRAAGVLEAAPAEGEQVLGTLQYTAPECLLGEPASWRSDLFAIGVIAYEMLTGRLPYGAQASRVRTRDEARALRYAPAAQDSRAIPPWIDGALRCAVHPDPTRRHEALSEFVADLKIPNPRFARTGFTPLAERDPVRFWQGVSLVLALIVFALLVRMFG